MYTADQEGTSDMRFSRKKNSLHTRQFIAPPCAIKGEKQFFGGKVRPHSVGCQFSSTRMISDALEIKIYSNIWFNSNWCQFIKVRRNSLKAGRSRCPGSIPWANLGSIDEVAEVKLFILKICGLDMCPRKGHQIRDSQKKNIAHTRQLVAPLCVIEGEKQSFGGKVRPHPVGGQLPQPGWSRCLWTVEINIWFSSNSSNLY